MRANESRLPKIKSDAERLRLAWLLLPDSYVGYTVERLPTPTIVWYAARRNDNSFHGKTKAEAIDKAVLHWIQNP